MALEPNNTPRMEAKEMLRLVRLGVDTPRSAIALIRIPEKQKRFLTPDEISYRQEVEAEFRKLLRPRQAPTPPPKPPASLVVQATLEALKELMQPPAPVQNLNEPLPRRGPYRKRTPPEDFASATIAAVARHFDISVAALITPGRGPIKGSGLPRWTAVLLLREGGMLVREIVDHLGYSDPAGPYMGLKNIAALRAQDPALDRQISLLLENMREGTPGT
jgi:hypothetical protein